MISAFGVEHISKAADDHKLPYLASRFREGKYGLDKESTPHETYKVVPRKGIHYIYTKDDRLVGYSGSRADVIRRIQYRPYSLQHHAAKVKPRNRKRK